MLINMLIYACFIRGRGLGDALGRFLHRMLPALNRLALRASATGTAADDALGLPELVAAVLAAIDDDDYDAVCKTAGSWCRAFEASGPSCRDAHDTWRALAARVFPGAPTLDKDNAQANFYALCRRANLYRSGHGRLSGSGDEDVRAFVMAAVKHSGYALRYADAPLKKDPEIVLAAVRQSGAALTYADEDLKKNRKIVLAAVNKDGYALRYADEDLKKDREIVLAAVTRNGQVLRYADALLKKDREIVLAAVNQDGYALRYADEDLKRDHKIVMAAVTRNGHALRYADGSLQNDPEIVLAAATAVAAAM